MRGPQLLSLFTINVYLRRRPIQFVRRRVSELIADRHAIARSPLTWIVMLAAIVRIVGIGWGLPASDGWDNDGVAPRDFLPGLASTFTPGHFYTYPPVHIALLAVITLPITCVAVLRAPSLAIHDIVGEIIKVPYMTATAYVSRLVSIVMSLATIVFIARIAEEIRAHELGIAGPKARDADARVRTAGYSAAAFVAVNASCTYYAHVTNLDVPYLFWATWALLFFTRAIARSEPRLLRRAFMLAVLAIGTKDQAYALFLLTIPIALGCWLWAQRGQSKAKKAIIRETLIAIGMATVLFAVVNAVIVNPSGFKARMEFLLGSASQDYVEYTKDWSGRISILQDAGRSIHLQYPFLIVPAIVIGLGRAAWTFVRSRSSRSLLVFLPLLVATSFMVTFNWSARRTDARFLLPEGVMIAVYGGLGIEWLVFAANRVARLAGQAVASVMMAKAIFVCIAVDSNMLNDPRYDAEAWLAAHVEPGDTIETYGLNVYMLRLAALESSDPTRPIRATRVGPEPTDKRNPMHGIEEVQDAFENAQRRNARFIVVSHGWVWRYLNGSFLRTGIGRQMAPTQTRSASDESTVRFFEELMLRGGGPFELVHESRYDDHIFPAVDIHGTTTRWVWIFERRPSRSLLAK